MQRVRNDGGAATRRTGTTRAPVDGTPGQAPTSTPRSATTAGEAPAVTAPTVARTSFQKGDVAARTARATGGAAATHLQQAKGPVQRATVVGGGPTGLATASLLLQRAAQIGLQELTIVEARPEYTRPVGLNFRQLNLDALQWLNPVAYTALAEKSGLVHPDPTKGFMESTYWDGDQAAYVSSGKPPGQAADGARYEAVLQQTDKSIAEHAHDMMNAPTVGVVTLRDLEDSYWAGLTQLAAEKGVTLVAKREHTVEWTHDPATGDADVSVKKRRGDDKAQLLPRQDLVLCAQGNSRDMRETRKVFGKDAAREASPAERFIAGIFLDPSPKGIAKSIYREEVIASPDGDRQTCRFIRSVHATNGMEWALLQVPRHLAFTPFSQCDVAAREGVEKRVLQMYAGKDLSPGLLEAECEAQYLADQVELYYRSQHAKTGVADVPCPFGPNMFELKAALFDTAMLAGNTHAVGDGVGNSHFNVSGGAATGVTLHTAALDRYLTAVASGVPKQAAGKQLDVDLRQATLTWQTFGITEFEGDPAGLREQFMPKELLASIFPPEIVDRYYPPDGGEVKKETNKAWHAWFDRAKRVASAAVAPVLPIDLTRRLIDAARRLHDDHDTGKTLKPVPFDQLSL